MNLTKTSALLALLQLLTVTVTVTIIVIVITIFILFRLLIFVLFLHIYHLLICTRLIATSFGEENPLSALHLYCPKSALLSSFILTELMLLVSCFSCEPSGLVHVILGTGTPSASHVSVMVWPIHEELSGEKAALLISALSVEAVKTKNVTIYLV